MTFAEFKALVEEAKAKWPSAFDMPVELGMKPEIASEEDIQLAQKTLNATLPEEYVKFLREYGGGLFGSSVDIYSVDPKGDWYLLKYQPTHNNEDFVAFAQNGCGDSYGFTISAGKCRPAVFFWDHEAGREITETEFADFYEFVADQVRHQIF